MLFIYVVHYFAPYITFTLYIYVVHYFAPYITFTLYIYVVHYFAPYITITLYIYVVHYFAPYAPMLGWKLPSLRNLCYLSIQSQELSAADGTFSCESCLLCC